MKRALQQVFHSGKFVVGFCIFTSVLLIVIIYPLIVPNRPLETVSKGSFLPPGIYANVYDSVYIMEHGKIVENGSADEVILHPKEAYTRRLINDVPKIYEEWDLSTV
jgi:hypothetical protein